MKPWHVIIEESNKMGQLSSSDAESFKYDLISYFRRCKADVRENFDEMDFDNADKKTEMEKSIVNMENRYDSLINQLSNMSFE